MLAHACSCLPLLLMRMFEDVIPAFTDKGSEENGGEVQVQLSGMQSCSVKHSIPLNTGSRDTDGVKHNVSNVKAPRLGVGN